MVWLKIEGEDESINLIEVHSIKAISIKPLRNGLGIIIMSDVVEIKQTLESDADPEEFAKALIEAS